jgi:hypothetical protein
MPLGLRAQARDENVIEALWRHTPATEGRSNLAPQSPLMNLARDVSWNNAVEPLSPRQRAREGYSFIFSSLVRRQRSCYGSGLPPLLWH